MDPINVFLDTSALPVHPARLGLGFESLVQLAEGGLAKVYLSEVVKGEWFSHLESDWKDVARNARKSIRTLAKHPWSVRMDRFADIESAADGLNVRPMEEYRIIHQSFEELFESLLPEVLPISDVHARGAFEKYFGGYRPFGGPRNRNDIPDAFIFESGIELAGKLKRNLHCVINDRRLREAFQRFESVTVHENLEDFVRSDPVRALMAKLEPSKVWLATLSTLVKSLPMHENSIVEQLGDLLSDELVGETVTHPIIPDDNSEGIIAYVEEPIEFEFNWRKFTDFGPGLLSVPFSSAHPATISFFVFRGEAYDVPNGVSVDFMEPWSDHYFAAEGTVSIEVSGSISLHFNLSDLGEDRLPILERFGVGEVESFEVAEDINGEIFYTSSDDPLYSAEAE